MLPGSTAEVAAVVTICHAQGVSIVPQGGHTGLVGGCQSHPGQIVLSLTRMAQWQGHFDPVIFQAFVKCIGIYPVGALVRLDAGKQELLLEQDVVIR